jgi:hypothetical protein
VAAERAHRSMTRGRHKLNDAAVDFFFFKFELIAIILKDNVAAQQCWSHFFLV